MTPCAIIIPKTTGGSGIALRRVSRPTGSPRDAGCPGSSRSDEASFRAWLDPYIVLKKAICPLVPPRSVREVLDE